VREKILPTPVFRRSTLYMDILHRCIVNDDNRPKSPFGCASVRVRTSRACLASRALYVKTRGEREGESRGTREQLCGPFCGASFKTSSSFTVTRKRFFLVARDLDPILTEATFAFIPDSNRSLAVRKYELCNVGGGNRTRELSRRTLLKMQRIMIPPPRRSFRWLGEFYNVNLRYRENKKRRDESGYI